MGGTAPPGALDPLVAAERAVAEERQRIARELLAGLRERVALVGGAVDSGPPRGRRLRRHGPPAARRRVMTTRVLIVDEQSLVRAGFRMILDAKPEIEVVGEAADGLTAVLAARETEPDVILMDVRMPNVDGLEATRRLLDGKESGPRILILTTFDLDEYVYEALRAGASGSSSWTRRRSSSWRRSTSSRAARRSCHRGSRGG